MIVRRLFPLSSTWLTILLWCCSSQITWSIPAPRTPIPVSQPDGTSIPLYKVGDEFHHHYLSRDGYTVLPDETRTFRYAVLDQNGRLVPGPVAVLNEPEADSETARYLQSIHPRLKPSADQMNKALTKRIRAAEGRPRLRSTSAGRFDHLLLNDFARQGTAKSLVILVNFKDVRFGHSRQAFDNLLNQPEYNEGNHIGSVKDYYTSNSHGAFSPEFVVVGPVTVSENQAYYGANDADGNDIRPWEMVREACQLAATQVNFADFDSNDDGVVDNVYVFYAGKGEADTDLANTIWPHSYSLTSAGIYLTLHGKKVDSYACSAERTGNGQMAGIGVFTHEFAHVLGLPDMYDVDYDSYNGEGFDLDAWSLMAQGAYNRGGAVPAGLTLLERYLLGWTEPTELNAPTTVNLHPLVTSNMGYILRTDNDGEFFLLENRQQLTGTWDQYLPHHGMLVYHIDMRSDAVTTLSYYGRTVTWSFERLWQYNMVNAIASHQCANILEADNQPVLYTGSNYTQYILSLKGDPFPGQNGVTSLTATTTPGLKTWSKQAIDKPLTDIREQGNQVWFDFMGGNLVMDVPAVRPASHIQPFSFTANWHSVPGATGYLLDVFTLQATESDTIKEYVHGYKSRFVEDTTLSIVVTDALTTYYYQVRSTNGYSVSEHSPIITLVTAESRPTALEATEVDAFGFTANWEYLPWASGYFLTVYRYDEMGSTWVPIPHYTNHYVEQTSFPVVELDHDNTYAYEVKGTTGVSTGRASEWVVVNTSVADQVVCYYRDGLLYVKGGDKDAPISLYNLAGTIIQTSRETAMVPHQKGLLFVEVWLKGRRRIIKVMVE